MAITDILFCKKEYKFGWDDAIRYSKYLGKAKDEIKIIAGELYAPYYSNSEVLENLEDAIKNNVTIKIIFGPAVYVDCKKILKLAAEGKIELFKMSRRLDKHFRVIDQQHVYISKPHAIDIETKKRSDKFIHWDIRPSPHGEIYEELFDEILRDYAERVKEIIGAFKERKVEYFKEGDKKGKVKTAKGFVKEKDGKIREATDEEINELERYIGNDRDTNTTNKCA